MLNPGSPLNLTFKARLYRFLTRAGRYNIYWRFRRDLSGLDAPESHGGVAVAGPTPIFEEPVTKRTARYCAGYAGFALKVAQMKSTG